MHRRALLASIAVGAAGLAGCASDSDDPPSSSTSSTDSPTATQSPTPTPWDSPGPTAETRFEGRSVPPIDERRSIQWYHEADESTVAFVRPSTERLELDGMVEFEVVNHSTARLQCGHWNLYKLVDGEWFHVGPFVHTSDCRRLEPGDTKRWSVQAHNGAVASADSGPENYASGYTREYLGGGTYAAVAGYGNPADESGALVELVGGPVTLQPAENVTVDREGATVTVTFPSYSDGEHPPDGIFTLSRSDSADERLVAEQLMGGDGYTSFGKGLRTALVYLDSDVDRVEVRGDDHLADAATGRDGGSRRFRFRGQAYLATKVAPDD